MGDGVADGFCWFPSFSCHIELPDRPFPTALRVGKEARSEERPLAPLGTIYRSECIIWFVLPSGSNTISFCVPVWERRRIGT